MSSGEWITVASVIEASAKYNESTVRTGGISKKGFNFKGAPSCDRVDHLYFYEHIAGQGTYSARQSNLEPFLATKNH